MKQGSKKAIDDILEWGVEQILPTAQDLKTLLSSDRPLRVKFGIDPTGEKIHIGRAIVLWKLRSFQNLGHTVVLIIGDFTAQIGDPSDKLEKRPFLTTEQIAKNMKNYLPQIGKILDLKRAEIRYNSEWLSKMDMREISHLAEQFTFQQMMQRRNFKDRFKSDSDISLHELFYPLMQGYDSVVVKADVELGGTDQLFNLLAGRKLQERYGQKPQVVITTKMLEGLDGRKMSTSWGNVINITDEPFDQYGKVLSMRDEVMPQYLELVSGLDSTKTRALIAELKQGKTNPKRIKEQLAYTLVARYHGEEAAAGARAKFNKTFSRKETPDDIALVVLKKKTVSVVDFLVEQKLAASKSEARRLIEQGAVSVNKKKISDWKAVVRFDSGNVVQVGKRRFVRIK